MNPSDLIILVFEDDPGDVEILRRHLEDIASWRVDLVSAADSQSGLAELSRRNVDVVLVDYMLGSDTGLTVLRAIREWHPETPVILLTGRGDENVAVEAMHAGASDYVPKSALSPRSLERSIQSAIERGRMRQMLKQYRVGLEVANRDLERRNDEIRSFYHTLSHELKTPLTSTMEFVSLLLEGVAGPLSDDQREYLEIARSGCRQIHVSINDLLDTSRIESGKLSIDVRPTNLEPVVSRTCRAMERTAAERGQKLSCEVEPDLPQGMVDVVRFQQVLGNLLSNAIKFTPDDGWILVRCGLDPADEQQLRIDVSDTGRGIAPEHLERIFDRLFQVHESDTEAGGLGIGLNLCRELVRLHNGHIRVQSEPGQGSTFTFTLPVAGSTLPKPTELTTS